MKKIQEGYKKWPMNDTKCCQKKKKMRKQNAQEIDIGNI